MKGEGGIVDGEERGRKEGEEGGDELPKGEICTPDELNYPSLLQL